MHRGGASGARSIAPSAQLEPFGAPLKTRWRPSPGLSFWISFFVLHFLLFLPVVLMDREDGALIPSFHFASLSLEQIWVSIVVWRRKPDLLRFNSEIVLFVALWALVRPLRHPARYSSSELRGADSNHSRSTGYPRSRIGPSPVTRRPGCFPPWLGGRYYTTRRLCTIP